MKGSKFYGHGNSSPAKRADVIIDGENVGTIFDTQRELEEALAEISTDEITYTLNRSEGRVEHMLSTVDVVQTRMKINFTGEGATYEPVI